MVKYPKCKTWSTFFDVFLEKRSSSYFKLYWQKKIAQHIRWSNASKQCTGEVWKIMNHRNIEIVFKSRESQIRSAGRPDLRLIIWIIIQRIADSLCRSTWIKIIIIINSFAYALLLFFLLFFLWISHSRSVQDQLISHPVLFELYSLKT